MRPFFFIGNRRSGTTMLCHLINMHPEMWNAFERYVVWILLQIDVTGVADGFVRHPWASQMPMWITLGANCEVIANVPFTGLNPENYRRVFMHIIEKHMRSQGWAANRVPQWLGEKNPTSMSDPKVLSFAKKVFPDAKYIHIVRHPGACVRSKRWLASQHGPTANNWGEWSKDEDYVFRTWLNVEQNVLAVDEIDIYHVRYEDFVGNPSVEMNRLLDFFGVARRIPEAQIAGFVKGNANDKHDLSVPDWPEMTEMMERWEYK